ncbi:hypothetical protein Tco_1393166 [Tanacetum coccineum]
MSHAWRRLFGIRAPLVHESFLEFLNTCRMSDTEMGLDVADTLCFQLGGVRRRVTWRHFILALGLHTEQEMTEAWFGAYWDGSDRVNMDDPYITMKEYIRIEEEKARRHGKVYNWKTATYGKIWYDEDVHDLGSIETEFPAIVFNDTLTSKVALSCEPMVSSLNDNKLDFKISFDESDDEDYTVIYDKNSFSYKIIFVDDLKTDLENDNDKVNMPSFPLPEPTVSYFDDLDFFKDFGNEFPAIVYNDALTSKSDSSTKSVVIPQHIDEFNLKDETSLSECDEEEQNVLYSNDLFPFNVIFPDDLKSDTDNDNDEIDIEQSSGDMSVIPLPNEQYGRDTICNLSSKFYNDLAEKPKKTIDMVVYAGKRQVLNLSAAEALVNTLFAQGLILESYLAQNIRERRELALEEDHVFSTFEVGQGSGSAPEPERPERVSTSKQPTLTTWTNPEDSTVYIDVPAYPPPAPPVQTPPSPEWLSGLLPISPATSIVPSPIPSPMIPLTVSSPVATPATAETEGFLTELGAQVEMQGGLSSQLKHEQEKVAMTFGAIWRPVLALESWAGQTDAQRAALWHAISDTQGENQELQLQLTEERRVRLELAEIVDNMRRGQEPRGDV